MGPDPDAVYPNEKIKKAEESVEAMKVARKSMLKYNSSFAEGLQT